jgi:hypothetical protein
LGPLGLGLNLGPDGPLGAALGGGCCGGGGGGGGLLNGFLFGLNLKPGGG